MPHGQLFYDQIRSGGAIVKTANYSLVKDDGWRAIIHNSVSAHTFTLPNPPPSLLWKVYITNIGSGILTISRNSLTIDGVSADVVVPQFTGVVVFSDGSNYFTIGEPAISGLLLQTNSVNNGSQVKLNLVAGVNLTLTDNGAGSVTIASGGGGGSGGITPNTATGAAAITVLDQTGWSAVNGAFWDDFLSNSIGVYCQDNVALNWRGAAKLISDYVGAATTYTIIAQIYCKVPVSASAFANGIYLYDGTKLYGIEMLTTTTAGQLRIQEGTNVTTASSTTFGPTANLTPYLLSVKIVEDGVHRTWSYWKNGAWVQALQEASLTFLTPTKVMVGGASVTNNVGNYAYTELRYLNITHP